MNDENIVTSSFEVLDKKTTQDHQQPQLGNLSLVQFSLPEIYV
jgi:hypothetical protein